MSKFGSPLYFHYTYPHCTTFFLSLQTRCIQKKFYFESTQQKGFSTGPGPVRNCVREIWGSYHWPIDSITCTNEYKPPRGDNVVSSLWLITSSKEGVPIGGQVCNCAWEICGSYNWPVDSLTCLPDQVNDHLRWDHWIDLLDTIVTLM